MHTLFRQPPRGWRVACLIAAFAVWCGLEVWAATVSTHAFGRYEIVLQEGIPVAMGEILGLVRRQTGLPEYPLMLRTQKRLLELSILGPGNRPIRLASTPSTWRTRVRAATARFIVERAVRQDETLTLQLRQASAPGQISLAVNLRNLERMLEGER
ncbi:MAG: hypothetical protein ACRERE_14190 [Candidatus Entotheonellia bacterium]